MKTATEIRLTVNMKIVDVRSIRVINSNWAILLILIGQNKNTLLPLQEHMKINLISITSMRPIINEFGYKNFIIYKI